MGVQPQPCRDTAPPSLPASPPPRDTPQPHPTPPLTPPPPTDGSRLHWAAPIPLRAPTLRGPQNSWQKRQLLWAAGPVRGGTRWLWENKNKQVDTYMNISEMF